MGSSNGCSNARVGVVPGVRSSLTSLNFQLCYHGHVNVVLRDSGLARARVGCKLFAQLQINARDLCVSVPHED